MQGRKQKGEGKREMLPPLRGSQEKARSSNQEKYWKETKNPALRKKII